MSQDLLRDKPHRLYPTVRKIPSSPSKLACVHSLDSTDFEQINVPYD
jgi:hypothetical protein